MRVQKRFFSANLRVWLKAYCDFADYSELSLYEKLPFTPQQRKHFVSPGAAAFTASSPIAIRKSMAYMLCAMEDYDEMLCITPELIYHLRTADRNRTSQASVSSCVICCHYLNDSWFFR